MPPPSPPVAQGPGAAAPKTEASMSGMFGILALVAVAGGGFYMYRKYKK
jgi:LPXTG-motif cell wall-anchored protein